MYGSTSWPSSRNECCWDFVLEEKLGKMFLMKEVKNFFWHFFWFYFGQSFDYYFHKMGLFLGNLIKMSFVSMAEIITLHDNKEVSREGMLQEQWSNQRTLTVGVSVDLNSDHRISKQARWPLDPHHALLVPFFFKKNWPTPASFFVCFRSF